MPPDNFTREVLVAELSEAVIDRLGDRYPQLLAPIRIDGIEVTQGIQYYDSDEHLTDPADRKANNKMPLVAYKAAFVRVYVSATGDKDLPGLDGTLNVKRPAMIFLPGAADFDLTPLNTSPPTAQATPNYGLRRSWTTMTLNFLIPAHEVVGELTLRAQVWIAGNKGRFAARTVKVSATLTQTLKLRGIMISYDGPDGTPAGNNLTLAAPTVADLATTAGHFHSAAPVRRDGIYSSAGTLEWDTPLTGVATGDGGCSLEWLALNEALAEIKADDGNRDDVIYYGLLPVGVPIANVGGCATDGVTSGPNGEGVTLSHEVGHAAGFQHAECGTDGDDNFPAYEPYDAAAPGSCLGEYGYDIDTTAVHQPAERDLMSYCGGSWFSLYNYNRLFNNERFSPTSVYRPPHIEIPVLVDPYLWPWEYIPDPGPDDPYWGGRRPRPQELISIIGRIDRFGEVTVSSVKRLTTLPLLAGAVALEQQVVLRDKAGGVAAQAQLMRMSSQGCGCGGCGGGRKSGDHGRGPFVFQAMLPASDRGVALEIAGGGREGSVLWQRKAGKRPQVRGLSVTVRGDTAEARWSASAGEHGERATLRFSKDGGKSWNTIGNRLKGEEHRFPITHLPAGKIVFEVAVSDGFSVSSARSKPVAIAERPPELAIQHPRTGSLRQAGQPMRLLAVIVSRDGVPAPVEEGVWLIDGKAVARGRDAWITAPPAGRHSCVFTLNGKRAGGVETTFETVAVREVGSA